MEARPAIVIQDDGRGISIMNVDGTRHYYRSFKDDHFHHLINKIADLVQSMYLCTGQEGFSAPEPEVRSEGAGGLQYAHEGLVAFCDLHGVAIVYNHGIWVCHRLGEVPLAADSDLSTMITKAMEAMLCERQL